jgi:hypothetical protein
MPLAIMFLTSCPNNGSRNESILNRLHKVDVYTHNVVKLVKFVSVGIEPFNALFSNCLHNRWKHTSIKKLINMKLLKLEYLQWPYKNK